MLKLPTARSLLDIRYDRASRRRECRDHPEQLVGLVTQPLFLCSATFFPLSAYPAWAERVIAVTPLYQGVAMERALITGTVAATTVGNAAYLVVMMLVCLSFSSVRFHRRLLH